MSNAGAADALAATLLCHISAAAVAASAAISAGDAADDTGYRLVLLLLQLLWLSLL